MATPETNHAVLDIRVSNLEKVVEEVAESVKSIDQSLQTLARLEVRHDETRLGLDRAFEEIADHETRLREVEHEMPTMKLVRNWIITGAIGVIGLAGTTIWAVFIHI